MDWVNDVMVNVANALARTVISGWYNPSQLPSDINLLRLDHNKYLFFQFIYVVFELLEAGSKLLYCLLMFWSAISPLC